jgi:sterol desaturase/sphingolipid hydroxylase (fatty acid hydroxylase superfamily)
MSGSAWLEYAVVLLILLPLLAVAERVAPEQPGAARLSWWSGARAADVGWLLVAVATVPPITGLAVMAADRMASTGLLATLLGHHAITSAIVGGLAYESVYYAIHRGEHRAAWLWPIHRTHHAARRLDAVSGFRFHPLDTVATRGVPVLVVALVGIPPGRLVPYLTVLFVVTMLAHADLAVPGRWLDWVVVTPGYHRTHHEVHGGGTNLAAVLPILDRCFGTYAPAGAERQFLTAAQAEPVGSFG